LKYRQLEIDGANGEDLLYLSTSFLWWQAVAGIIGGKSSNALRINSWCTWQTPP